MNKTFKSIWNAATCTFTAVSEHQHARGKRSKNRLAAAVLSAAAIFSNPSGTAAAPLDEYQDVYWQAPWNDIYLFSKDGKDRQNMDTDFHLGSVSFEYSNEKAGSRWYENLTIGKPHTGNPYVLNLTDEGAKLDVSKDTSLLLSHSAGFAQQIVSVGSSLNMSGLNGNDFTVNITDAYGNGTKQTFEQKFVDKDGKEIGTATYDVGGTAYDTLNAFLKPEFRS